MDKQEMRDLDETWDKYPRQYNVGQGDIGIIKEFSKDLSIPPEMLENFWGFVATEVVWANFSPDDEAEWDNLLHLAIEKMKAAIPYFEYTPDMDAAFTNLVATARRKIMRARGADRERVLLATEIQERRLSTNTIGARKEGRFGGIRGAFSRLLGG